LRLPKKSDWGYAPESGVLLKKPDFEKFHTRGLQGQQPFRQYRTILTVRLRRRIFRQSKQKYARIAAPIRKFLRRMTEKRQAGVPPRLQP